MARCTKPKVTESHRFPPECESPIFGYLNTYHEQSWWSIKDHKYDEFFEFVASPTLCNIVYAFVQGWKAAIAGYHVEVSKDTKRGKHARPLPPQ